MAHRTFMDGRGVLWEVWCVVPSEHSVVREKMKNGWLAFRSTSEVRRLPPCRDDLADLPADELRALLGEAQSQGAPRRLVE